MVSPLGEYIFEEEARNYVSSSIGSLVGEGSGKCEGAALGESLGVEFLPEVGSSLGLSVGCVEIKLDGSSVEFDMGFVGLLTLGTDAVVAEAVGARNSALISGVILYWIIGEEK